MKKYTLYILILLTLSVGFLSPVIKASAEDQQGTCTITERVGGGSTVRTYTVIETEAGCRARARFAPVSLAWTGCTFTSNNGTQIPAASDTDEARCKALPGGTFKSHLMLPVETTTISNASSSTSSNNWYWEYKSNLTKANTIQGPYSTQQECQMALSIRSDLGAVVRQCFQSSTPPTANNPTTTVDPKYYLLAPLPCENTTPGCVNGKLENFDPSQPNNFGAYLNLMIKIFIGLCAVLSVVMMVIGGVEVMTSELSHTKEAGKEKITQAILGLVIALGAYALLFTINPDLLKSDLNPPPASITIPTVKQGRCAIILDTSVWNTATVYHQNKTEAECNALKPAKGSASWTPNP